MISSHLSSCQPRANAAPDGTSRQQPARVLVSHKADQEKAWHPCYVAMQSCRLRHGRDGVQPRHGCEVCLPGG